MIRRRQISRKVGHPSITVSSLERADEVVQLVLAP
jgi:hypothetical protein